ncbi:MAG: PAS domain S-box protein [Desulfarculus sp.]|nr:PAS domain S-box protein [Desulfarculus sp.]
MWRSPLMARLLGALAALALVGLAGLWWLHQWSLERHLRQQLPQRLELQADLVAGQVRGNLRLRELHRQHEGLSVRRELEVLARAYLEMCQGAHRRQQKGELSQQQAQEQVRQALLSQRVGLGGYPFVWDISRAPESIPLAVHPKIQGVDVAYVDFVRQGAQMKRGYLEYRWANPGEAQVRDKVAALEYFEPWQWVICVSAYREEFHLMVEQGFHYDAQRQLGAFLAGLQPGPGGHALVVDDEGRVVHGPAAVVAAPQPPALLAAVMGQEQGGFSLEMQGQTWLGAYRNLPPLGRLVLLAPEGVPLAPEGVPLAPALASQGHWHMVGLAAGLALGLLALAAILFLWVGRPLEALAGAAQRLADGVLEEEPPPPAGHGELGRMAGALTTISNRFRESLAYLAQSERRYRDLFENAPDPGYVISRGGFVMEVNQAMEQVLGQSRQQVHGLHLSQMLKPGQEQEVSRRLELVAGDGQAISGLGFTVLDKQGQPRYLEGFLMALHDGQGRPQGFFGLARDLTEQRRLQEQLLQAQKMEIMGTLAGGIAHDFNNLLSGIMGYSSLMLVQPGLDERLTRYLRIIDNSAGRAAALTQQLLTLAKVGHSGRQPVEVNTVVRDVLTILEHSLQARVEVQARLAPDLPVVEADPGQLHQVLMNLCINARDAMPQGGRLVLETCLTDLGQGASQAVAISVADNGQGMDESTRLQALEPFFTTKEQGTGLGLPMAQGIIQKHGGTLEIVSQPGQGTTVRVFLPPGRAGLTLPSPLEPTDLVEGRETVLVVDDEPEVRELAMESLALCGYRALAAASGQEALDLLTGCENPPDLLLLDLMMPGLGGLDLLPLVKERFPGLKVILVSGMYDPREEGSPPWRQAEAFLPKPYRVPALLALVRQVLDQTRATRSEDPRGAQGQGAATGV